MKRAVAFALAFATLGLTACSGSTTVVENSEPKVVDSVQMDGRLLLVWDDGNITLAGND